MPTACVFGYVTKEWEIHPGGIIREIVGGGAYFVSVALRSLGASVRLIVRMCECDRHLLEELSSMGISVELIPSSTTMKCRLRYERDGSRTIEVIEPAQPFEPSDVSKCIYADAVYVGPQTQNDFSLEFLERASRVAPLFLDVQGFTRRVVNGVVHYVDWEWKGEAARFVDTLKVDDKEARILTGRSNIVESLNALHELGFKNVLLTTNEGVYLSTPDSRFFARYKVARVVGRTGRGDTAVAAYMYSRMMGLDPRQGIALVAAAVSIKLGSVGPLRASLDAVLSLSKEIEVEEL